MKKRRKPAPRTPQKQAKTPGARAIGLPANQLARLEQLEHAFDRAVEQAKLDAMKELAYGASHEINNPLANISTRAQSLLKTEPDPERQRMLAAIHQQAMRAHEMIADLMLFARPPQMVRAKIDLAKLLARVVSEFSPLAIEQHTELALAPPLPSTHPKGRQRPGASESIEIDADETQLAVALRAIIQNALEALGREGRIDVGLNASDESATITITDSGPGIPPEIRPHIFEPFYSGREAGRGLGFGLSKAWRIVTDHGGKIDVASMAENGSKITISIPSLADPSAAQ